MADQYMNQHGTPDSYQVDLSSKSAGGVAPEPYASLNPAGPSQGGPGPRPEVAPGEAS